MSILVWFQRDLRVEDHPALEAALRTGQPVIPVFVWSPQEEGAWSPGAASRWALHQALQTLSTHLKRIGLRLVLRRSASVSQALVSLSQEVRAHAVYWNRAYTPAAMARDVELSGKLQRSGIACQRFPGDTLFEPGEVLNQSGNPFVVFTPFWKACLHRGVRAPSDETEAARLCTTPCVPPSGPASLDVGDLSLLPRIPWDKGLYKAWDFGPGCAQATLDRFVECALGAYHQKRDYPGVEGTSRLSPYLALGQISVRSIWRRISQELPCEGQATYLKELGWREFAYHVLYHFPYTPDTPLKMEFQQFPWQEDPVALEAWQRGVTGYPIIDAGMRELWATGWMHNRVRMIVGSFLVKNSLLSWAHGARWFWDTLVDADLASNTLGWQWVGGCGADAAPYFRVFNPVLQGQKFDPTGAYVRRWVPELAQVPLEVLHTPWAYRGGKLQGYPAPIVDLDSSRKRALAAYHQFSHRVSEQRAKASVRPLL